MVRVTECVTNCVPEEGTCIGDPVCGVVVASIDETGDTTVCHAVEGAQLRSKCHMKNHLMSMQRMKLKMKFCRHTLIVIRRTKRFYCRCPTARVFMAVWHASWVKFLLSRTIMLSFRLKIPTFVAKRCVLRRRSRPKIVKNPVLSRTIRTICTRGLLMQRGWNRVLFRWGRLPLVVICTLLFMVCPVYRFPALVSLKPNMHR